MPVETRQRYTVFTATSQLNDWPSKRLTRSRRPSPDTRPNGARSPNPSRPPGRATPSTWGQTRGTLEKTGTTLFPH